MDFNLNTAAYLVYTKLRFHRTVHRNDHVVLPFHQRHPCPPVHVLDHLAVEGYDGTLVGNQECLATAVGESLNSQVKFLGNLCCNHWENYLQTVCLKYIYILHDVYMYKQYVYIYIHLYLHNLRLFEQDLFKISWIYICHMFECVFSFCNFFVFMKVFCQPKKT